LRRYDKEMRRAEIERMSQQPKFAPASGPKVGATPSVLRMNLK
jgi:hypothetical protein